MERLSCCIISYNEEEQIGECLDSVSFCDEIVVVDSGSEDATVEIAGSKGARIIENKPFPGHVEQKNFAIRSAAYDWVLCLDCDERVTGGLREEIIAEREKGFDSADGYTVKRVNWYLGKKIRFGALKPSRRLRLFDRRKGKWGGINPHDHVYVDGRVKRLRHCIEHFPYKDVKHHLSTMEKYTTILAEASYRQGRRAFPWDPYTRPVLFFLATYFLRLGLLEGWRGMALSILGSRYTYLKWKKLASIGRGRK